MFFFFEDALAFFAERFNVVLRRVRAVEVEDRGGGCQAGRVDCYHVDHAEAAVDESGFAFLGEVTGVGFFY